VRVARTETPARPGRWTRNERRAQVAAVTLEVIACGGVQAATLGRIAEAAGVSTPSLYNHFSGRAEILEAAMDLLRDRVFAWLDSSSHPNVLERLRELIGRAHETQIAADHDWVLTPLFELVAAARGEGMTEQMGRRQLEVLKRFVDIIEEGKRQGTIRPDTDAETVAWSLMGLGWTKDFAALQGLDHFRTNGTAGKILEMIIRGIASESPPIPCP
jgi:AcrR family transcriptional regulator